MIARAWLFSCFVALVTGSLSNLGSGVGAADPIRLWSGPAPGARGDAEADIPTLTPFLPAAESATGAAIIICPGGGYGALAEHEGATYAQWFHHHGIAAFVLRYRLGSTGYRHPVPLTDATRALRLVRSRAKEWGIDPKRIGIIGSSAGGHLAATLLTHWDAGDPKAEDPIERESSRPDFGILCYAVISMGELTHEGSRRNLLGDAPDPALVRLLSNELQVTASTPPCFLWHTSDDAAVKVGNSLEFASALARAGVPFDLHVYEHGAHGLGLGVATFDAGATLHPWASACLDWLHALHRPLK